MASSQPEIREYIKDTLNDPWYQHCPEYSIILYEVVHELYQVFACGYEQYTYTRDDIMCKEIEQSIGSFIDDFDEKYSIISKFLQPY